MSKKLRNKKTGDVGDLLGSCDSVPFIGIMVDYHDGNPVRYEYDSLAKFNEEWEDYESKEPLIIDDAAAKFVRLWAKHWGIEEIRVMSGAVSAELDGWSKPSRRWQEVEILEESISMELEENKTYTITELCGEGEE